MGGNQMGGNQMGGNQMGDNQMGGNQMGGNQMGGNQMGGNPMMGNQFGGRDGRMGDNPQFNEPVQSIHIYASPSALQNQDDNNIPSQLKPGFSYSQPEEMIRREYPNNAPLQANRPDYDNGRPVPGAEPWRRDGDTQVPYGQPAEAQYPAQYMPEERFPYGNGPEKEAQRFV